MDDSGGPGGAGWRRQFARAQVLHRAGRSLSAARFAMTWGLAVRMAPFLTPCAPRIRAAGDAAAAEATAASSKAPRTIPRYWYAAHIIFWFGSGVSCWLKFRRADRRAARRHLLRSLWVPPLVWLSANLAVALSVPYETLLELIRASPYTPLP